MLAPTSLPRNAPREERLQSVMGDVGDDGGFGSFLRAHHATLYRAAYLLTGNEHTAEELLQETVVRLYPRWSLVSRADVPVAYVRRALVNVFISRGRTAAARTATVPLSAADGLPDDRGPVRRPGRPGRTVADAAHSPRAPARRSRPALLPRPARGRDRCGDRLSAGHRPQPGEPWARDAPDAAPPLRRRDRRPRMTTDDDFGRALAESLTYVASQSRPPQGLVERLSAWRASGRGVGVGCGGCRSPRPPPCSSSSPSPGSWPCVTSRRGLRKPATTGAAPTYGSRSAASLASARWTSLPDAPIEGRRSAVGAWTGSQMLVWGGVSTTSPQRLLGDGASYDPTARRWSDPSSLRRSPGAPSPCPSGRGRSSSSGAGTRRRRGRGRVTAPRTTRSRGPGTGCPRPR